MRLIGLFAPKSKSRNIIQVYDKWHTSRVKTHLGPECYNYGGESCNLHVTTVLYTFVYFNLSSILGLCKTSIHMYLYNRLRNIDNISFIWFMREVECSNTGGCIDFVLYILHRSRMLCVSSHAEPAHVWACWALPYTLLNSFLTTKPFRVIGCQNGTTLCKKKSHSKGRYSIHSVYWPSGWCFHQGIDLATPLLLFLKRKLHVAPPSKSLMGHIDRR